MQLRTIRYPELDFQAAVTRALAALLILVASLGCAADERPQRIVLVTLDTLRLDSFSGVDGAAGEMPATRRWASEGLVFERAYAATSTTQPTHASILTGLHPWEHGVTRNGMLLQPDVQSVAELLSAAGFETAAVVGSFPLHRRFGFAQGFDSYDDSFTRGLSADWAGMKIPVGGFYALGTEVNERAFRVLDAMEADRQFLWVHYFDPHVPYGDASPQKPDLTEAITAQGIGPELLIRTSRLLYDLDVRALDDALEALHRRLEADADRIDTHVVVTSDHGESFGEDGAFGHGQRVSDEQIRVPLFIVSPNVEPGVRRDAVGSIDVAATLLDLAGIGQALARGRSLLQPPAEPRRVVGMRRSVSEGTLETLLDGRTRPLPRHRFFAVEDGVVFRGNGGGLDTPADRAHSPEAEEHIRSLFDRFEDELMAHPAQAIDDDDTRAALEALGYGE